MPAEAPSEHIQETKKPDLPSEPGVSEPDEPPPTSVTVKKAGGKAEKYEKEPVGAPKVSRDAGIHFTVQKPARRATDEPPKARLVYSSDFTKPTGWDESHSEPIKLFRLDGYYHIAVYRPQKDPYYFAYFNPPLVMDSFRALVDVELNIQSGKSAECGIVCSADGQYSFCDFVISATGFYCLRHEGKKDPQIIINWRESEFIKSGDNTNTLMIERVGQKVTLGINGHIVATEIVSDLKPGYVGLFVRSFKDDLYAEARFRNFLIYAIEK